MSKDDILKVWCFYPVRPDFFAKPPYYRGSTSKQKEESIYDYGICYHNRVSGLSTQVGVPCTQVICLIMGS